MHSSFNLKVLFFKIAKVTKYLGCFCHIISNQELIKIAQSCHTARQESTKQH